MVALRLDEDPRPIPQYSIVGSFGDEAGFITHVGLLTAEHAGLRFREVVEVCHMRPPLVVDSNLLSWTPSSELRETVVNVVGHLATLRAPDRAGIATWLADIATEVEPASTMKDGLLSQYVISPPMMEWDTDEISGTRRARRFSCVGFVQSCYDEGAGVVLLDLTSDLPEVEEDLLQRAYGIRLELIEKLGARYKVDLRHRLGIPGSPPWRVALAGYLFHALDRPDEEVRTVPFKPSGLEEAWFNPGASIGQADLEEPIPDGEAEDECPDADG